MNYKNHVKQGLTHGMDQATDSALVPNNEAKYLLNVTLDQPGNWAVRKGTGLIGSRLSSTDQGWGLFTHEADDGTHTLMAVSERDLFAFDEGTLSWSSVDTNVFTADKKINGASFNGKLYLSEQDGGVALQSTTGSTASPVQPSGDTNYSISGSVIETQKNSILVGADPKAPSTIFYTNPFTEQFYQTTGTCASNADSEGSGTVILTTDDFEPDDLGAIIYNSDTGEMFRITEWIPQTSGNSYVQTDGDTSSWDDDTIYVIRTAFTHDAGRPVTAIAGFKENVVSFDERDMYLWDPTSPNWSRKFPGKGCINERCVGIIDSRLIWMSQDGFYMWTGDGNPIDITTKIRDLVYGYGLWDLINFANKDEFCAGVINSQGKIYFSVGSLSNEAGAPASMLSNAVLVFDMKKSSWLARSYPEQIVDFAEFTDTNGFSKLYGITKQGGVIQMDTGSQDSNSDGTNTDIAVKIQTAFHVLSDPIYTSIVREYMVKAQSDTTLSLGFSTDQNTTYTSIGTIPATGDYPETILAAPPREATGYGHSIEIARNSGSGNLVVEAYGFQAGTETSNRTRRI